MSWRGWDGSSVGEGSREAPEDTLPITLFDLSLSESDSSVRAETLVQRMLKPFYYLILALWSLFALFHFFCFH